MKAGIFSKTNTQFVFFLHFSTSVFIICNQLLHYFGHVFHLPEFIPLVLEGEEAQF